MAKKRVDSRDVLDPNARTKAPFRGTIVGHFRTTGPNAWDDFEYVEAEGGAIEVLADLEVQTEPPLPRLRLRRRGRVQVVEWRPTPEDEVERKRARLGIFEFFARRHLVDYSSPPATGLAAVIHKKLKDGDRDGR
jgi:hypothetical protein